MGQLLVGIIGGSGLGQALSALGEGESVEVETPFGAPAGPIVRTEVDGVPVALLARHGPGHRYNPSRVPYRANIFALKKIGVTHLLATGAVGSLRAEIEPRHLALPDQLIDRTFRRDATFFDNLAVHVELASPFCPTLRAQLLEASRAEAVRVHERATYICMEGPQFSTRAESELHRSMGGDLIGMTALPEAKLAREASLCYGLVALPTDYDSWRPPRPGVTQEALLEEIIGNLKAATQQGIDLIRRVLPLIRSERNCHCASAMKHAVWSDPSTISLEEKNRLRPLLADG